MGKPEWVLVPRADFEDFVRHYEQDDGPRPQWIDDALSRASIPGGVGVKVKKLKWQTLTPGFSLQRSACPLGDYRVWEDADGAWEWALNDEKHSDGCEETPDAAKSAAQADYERRILSALDLSPAAPSNPVISDEMVAAALQIIGIRVPGEERMRAALTAALSVKPQSGETK